jgi:hypothetical protein
LVLYSCHVYIAILLINIIYADAILVLSRSLIAQVSYQCNKVCNT